MVLPIVALRAAVMARRVAATRKIARLRKMGVELSGTEFDPRAALGKIGRFNTKQLEGQMRKLDEFIDRRTQFVGDKSGRPIPKHEWTNYKNNIERQYNEMIIAKRKAVEDLLLPNGTTIGERTKMLKDIRRMATDFDVLDKMPSDFVSRAGLEKVGSALRKQQRLTYQSEILKTRRGATRKMLDDIGRSDLGDLLDQLDDTQYRVLTENTPFIDEAAEKYKREREGKGNMVFSDETDSELEELIAWAAKIRL